MASHDSTLRSYRMRMTSWLSVRPMKRCLHHIRIPTKRMKHSGSLKRTKQQRCNASLPFCAILSSSFSVSWAPNHCGLSWIEPVGTVLLAQCTCKRCWRRWSWRRKISRWCCSSLRPSRGLKACGPVMFLICPHFRTRMPKDFLMKTAHWLYITNSTIYLRRLPPEV